MGTFLEKLRNRLMRDRDVPITLQLRDAARTAMNGLGRVVRANLVLRDCDEVGAWVRAEGGAPVIRNAGRITVREHAILVSRYAPVQLTTGEDGAIIGFDQDAGILLGDDLRRQEDRLEELMRLESTADPGEVGADASPFALEAVTFDAARVAERLAPGGDRPLRA